MHPVLYHIMVFAACYITTLSGTVFCIPIRNNQLSPNTIQQKPIRLIPVEIRTLTDVSNCQKQSFEGRIKIERLNNTLNLQEGKP
jgi:hypothetical protein